jgi:hypothetical protein
MKVIGPSGVFCVGALSRWALQSGKIIIPTFRRNLESDLGQNIGEGKKWPTRATKSTRGDRTVNTFHIAHKLRAGLEKLRKAEGGIGPVLDRYFAGNSCKIAGNPTRPPVPGRGARAEAASLLGFERNRAMNMQLLVRPELKTLMVITAITLWATPGLFAQTPEAKKFTTFDVPNASFTAANSINPRGDIVGVFGGSRAHGFLLREGVFTKINFPGARQTFAIGLNPQGEIVGLYEDQGKNGHGFLLSDGKFTTIDFPGATFTNAIGINPRGDIVGEYDDAGGNSHGFLLSHNIFSTIDVPGATFTFAESITPRGAIVGFFGDSSGNPHGFLLSKDRLTTVDFPGAAQTLVFNINPRGDIVGDYIDNSGNTHGFLLSKGNFTTIDFPGSVLTDANGINPQGDIVGDYTDSSGNSHGFLLSN